MNMPTSEVLDLAADEIQEHGWRRGNAGWENPDGLGLCLEGAIAAAVGSGIRHIDALPDRVNLSALARCPAYKAVQAYLETDGDLWRWNDSIGRTQEDVIAVLRAAAAVERSREDLALRDQANASLARAKEAAYAPVEVAA